MTEPAERPEETQFNAILRRLTDNKWVATILILGLAFIELGHIAGAGMDVQNLLTQFHRQELVSRYNDRLVQGSIDIFSELTTFLISNEDNTISDDPPARAQFFTKMKSQITVLKLLASAQYSESQISKLDTTYTERLLVLLDGLQMVIDGMKDSAKLSPFEANLRRAELSEIFETSLVGANLKTR